MQRFYTLLDNRVFPAIVAYATHRLHILLLLVLGVFLLLGGRWTSAELIGGNYTNITSALLACIILIQQVAHHQEVKDLHQRHAEKLADLHRQILHQEEDDGHPTTVPE